MADPRSEAEIAGGFIRLRMGGTTREVPTLKIAAARSWKDGLGSHLTKIGLLDVTLDKADVDKTVASITPILNLATDAMIDILLSYDITNALGGKAWIEEHADDAEVYAALRRVMAVVFPFIQDARSLLETALPLIRQYLANAAPSVASISTNGASPPGVSIPGGSKPGSTKGS